MGSNEDDKDGGKTKYFDGSKPEELRGWKQTISAGLLSQTKKDGAHDTSTWGPYIIKFLRGEAAEIFEEEDIEKYAVRDGHRLVWAELEREYPYKQPLEKKLEVLAERRNFKK